MAMSDFTSMNLSLVGVSSFYPADLYCLNNSPLQNTTLFPGCYGICANPDVSGIGNRLSLYIQTILTLWLATLAPHPGDTLGAMLAAIAASFTVFAATLAQYAYNNITFHHTIVTINLSNLPTVAFFAGILRLRLQPGVIPLGPKLFATPILMLQFLCCAVSVFLGVGLNSATGGGNAFGGRGTGGWSVAQPQCNKYTQVIIFGRSLRFWEPTTVGDLSNMTSAERIVILVAYGIIIFLPFISSIICLYTPETGTLRVFASTFHQEKRTNVFALMTFFVLSNAWLGILIYATEEQIKRNKVLPGEGQWGSGQILAMLLIVVPLLGCTSILIQEVGDRNLRARRWIKRCKIHRLFGITYHDHSAPASTPGTPKRPGTPRRRFSKDQSVKSDLESGKKTPDDDDDEEAKSMEKEPPSDTRPSAARRLSKKSRYEPTKPEDALVVSPGDDSGPEDAPGSAKRPKLSAQNTLVGGGSWMMERDNKRKSTGSIAAASVHSRTGSVKVIVHPNGQMNRVLSRRSSYAGGGNTSEREDDNKSTKSGRRLSKRRPDSELKRGESSMSASRMSRSEDGYWSAAENLSRNSRRASAVGSPIRDDNDAATIRRTSNGPTEDNDDPLSKYYWDRERGWLERK